MSSEARTVNWSIGKAQGSLSVNKSSILLEEEGATDTITVTRLGNGTITATTSDSSICTVSVNNTTRVVTVTAVNDGTATVTISCAQGSNYTAPASVKVNVSCELQPLENLDNLSWAEIVQIAKSGRAAKRFVAGATKTITFSSQIYLEHSLSIAANSSWKAYILGIDHNPSKEGTNRIHFCIGRKVNGTEITFYSYKMNLSGTNLGGWESCLMRTWLNETFINGLPSDLTSVITPCTKYTYNAKDYSDVESAITSTSDKLWLLSEFEVYGSRSHASQYEQNKQKQYDYYKNGNSKIRKYHTSNSTVSWWLRSPCSATTSDFCFVTNDKFNGVVSIGGASDQNIGVVPCFTIS